MTSVAAAAADFPPPYQTNEKTHHPTQAVAAHPYQQQQVPVMVTPMYTPTVVQQIPKEYVPNDYITVTVVILIVGAIFNLTSLFYTIPAAICSVYARDSKIRGGPNTKRFAMAALILNTVAILWIIVWAVALTLFYFCIILFSGN